MMQEFPGFLMLLTGEGKLLYLSDSVSEHLGHSMVSGMTFSLKHKTSPLHYWPLISDVP